MTGMLKKDARAEYRQKRLSMTVDEATKADDLMLIQFQSADIPFLNSVLYFFRMPRIFSSVSSSVARLVRSAILAWRISAE